MLELSRQHRYVHVEESGVIEAKLSVLPFASTNDLNGYDIP